MATTNLETHTEAFMAMADKLKSFSRRDGRTLMEEQARGVLRTLLLVMPPSTTKVRGAKAKKRGEAAIASDVRKVFVGSTPKRAEVSSMGEMVRIMNSKRRVGQIRIRGSVKQTRAARSMITEFIKKKQKWVGYLASGWATAARGLGKIRVPNWIGRHSAPGITVIDAKNTSVSATLSNMVDWAHNIHRIDARIAYAVRYQTGKMNRRVKHFVEKAIKAADR